MFLKYRIENFYYSIRDLIFPRQRWLTKKIPNSWVDKDSLIEIALFECLTDFVEDEVGKEKLFNPKRWSKNDNVSESQLKFEKELKEIYIMATEMIPYLEKELELAWKEVPEFNFDRTNKPRDYHETYGRVDKIEGEIGDLKTEILVWICRNRNSMWT